MEKCSYAGRQNREPSVRGLQACRTRKKPHYTLLQ